MIRSVIDEVKKALPSVMVCGHEPIEPSQNGHQKDQIDVPPLMVILPLFDSRTF